MLKYQAFISYARLDDSDDAITVLRLALERFLGARLGQPATIFQDAESIRIGHVWETEIQNALGCPSLIPIVTPAYLNSPECVKEFLDFASVESSKQQPDRILPLYYIEVGAIEQRLGRPVRLLQNYSGDQLRVVDMILSRQMEDIRWFRTRRPQEAIDTAEARALLDRIAQQVACMAGPVRLSGLGITADGFNGVIVSGGSCLLERCEVSDTRYSCVLVRNGAQAILLMCALHNGQHCGVHASERSTVNVLSSTLRDNRTGGLFYSQESRGLVEGNDIEANALNGIYVAAGAQPVIRRNRIRGHSHAGVLVYLHSEWREFGPPAGIIEDNDISGGSEFGIQIEDGSNPCVRLNRIHHNKWGGIRVWKKGRGAIYDNCIRENGGSGIKNEDGSPWIGANTFEENGGQPVEGAAIITSEAPPDCAQ